MSDRSFPDPTPSKATLRFDQDAFEKSMTVATNKSITAEELLAMGDIGRCELLFGEIVMMSTRLGMSRCFPASFWRYYRSSAISDCPRQFVLDYQ